MTTKINMREIVILTSNVQKCRLPTGILLL